MPSLFEQVGKEVMYRANVAVTPPNTEYIRENNKVLSGTGYFKDLYLQKPIEDHNQRASEYFKKQDFKRNDLGYTIAQNILYQAAKNPSRN